LKALLLAAGLGTRLRPITNTIPKCLVPIHGRPLLDYWFELLFQHGIERALVNTHYFASEVESFIRQSVWRDQLTTVYERQLLGTGGTVLDNGEWFGNEAFMVVHADNLSRFNVQNFIAAHRRRPPAAAMTMMTFDTDAPQSCGIVETDADGVVQRFHEKSPNPPGTRANGAVYIFQPEVIDFLRATGRSIIDLSTEVIPAFLGRIATYHNTDYHRDIGTVESLAKAEREYAVQ
jgi:mannose-1-phosphate guanylyltransferase